MDHTPSEILLELFFFLDRNEIERNQLVCRRWNSAIHKSLSLMPYRKLKGFDIITSPVYSVIAGGEVIFEVGDRESVQRRAESLKYCIIEELKLGSSHDLRTKPIQARYNFCFSCKKFKKFGYHLSKLYHVVLKKLLKIRQ